MSKKSDNITIWYHTPKEMDRTCLHEHCGMQAQVVFHGGFGRELPLCNSHAALCASNWDAIQMIEEPPYD